MIFRKDAYQPFNAAATPGQKTSVSYSEQKKKLLYLRERFPNLIFFPWLPIVIKNTTTAMKDL